MATLNILILPALDMSFPQRFDMLVHKSIYYSQRINRRWMAVILTAVQLTFANLCDSPGDRD